MASDLEPNKSQAPSEETTTTKLGPSEILKAEVHEGKDALKYPVSRLLLSGMSAGLDLGFSVFLMAVMMTVTEDHFSTPVRRMLVANMYSVGFIFVVLGRSELFTEQTTLAVLPVLSGQAPLKSLAKLWSAVYVSNLAGAAAFAGITRLVGPALGVIDPKALVTLAHRMTDHDSDVIFLSAILAGWMMGLLSWLVAAGRDTISHLALVWLITWSIGFAGLHHVIAGAIEVFAGAFVDHSIGMGEVGRFLLWTTLGNVVGGTFFVALIKFGHARSRDNDSASRVPEVY